MNQHLAGGPDPRGSDTSKAIAFVQSLAAEGYWGNVTLKLQGGNVIHVLLEQSLKPNQLQPDHRTTNEQHNTY